MKDKINSILSEVKTKISEAANENELQNVKNAYVGKQGALSMLLKEMPKLDAALRPEMGKVLNQAKNQVTELRYVQTVLKEFIDGDKCLLIEIVRRFVVKDLADKHLTQRNRQLIDQASDSK